MSGTIGPGSGNLADVDVLLADAADESRKALAQSLTEAGCRRLQVFGSIPDLKAAMEGRAPDLIMIDHAFGRRIADFIDALRHGRVGLNPFALVLVTTTADDGRLVSALMRQGADDVIIKPIASRSLIDRIEYMAVHRRPFVVTTDYVGPDRRTDQERGGDVPQFEVPNTLLARITGQAGSSVDTVESIGSTVNAIVGARLEQHAQALGVLSHLLIEAHFAGAKRPSGAPPRSRAWFNVMLSIVRDVQRIGRIIDNAALTALARTLRQQIQVMARRHGTLIEDDVQFLRDLAEAVQMTIGITSLPQPDIDAAAKAYQRHGAAPKPPSGPIVLPKTEDDEG